MKTPVGLIALVTACPPHDLPQEDVARVAREVFEPRYPHFARLAPVFATAGVRRRQSVMPMEWYLQPLGWPERMAAFAGAGADLFCRAAQAALDEAEIAGAEVDVIVTVCTTGVAAPSLEARAMERMGFRPDVARVPVFGLGCAGGTGGLALAAQLASAQPGAIVLLVCLELCTLSFRMDDVGKADIVATALFGDGAAACVLKAGEEGIAQVRSFAEHTWPGTLEVMGWRIDPTGMGVIFVQSIPAFARSRLRAAMESMLARQGLELSDVDRFVCHPGGVKVMEAIEAALELGQGSLDHEREVLAEHGNMSSPTVLHVLDRVRRKGLPRRSVLTALGPGFTASTVTLAA